jgi:glycosyltransferase involved in cell wall biosynthesis
MKPSKRIAFVSLMESDPWGGSEVLWSQAAMRLARDGHAVSASVSGWPARPEPIFNMMQAGVNVHERWIPAERFGSRPARRFVQRLLEPLARRARGSGMERWLGRAEPDLVCISNGWIGDEQGVMGLIARSGRPYSIIIQANAENWWPDDASARMLIDIYQHARRLFFVSERNWRLLETQLGIELANAEVVRNPCSLRRNAALPWPAGDDTVQWACIGRLNPAAKGQDLLLQTMASEPWRSRAVTVSFFGSGPCEEGLRRLARRLGLEERVRFCGQVDDVEKVWTTHHALVLPSRYEGLPLVMVEAMLCGRPVILTDVAGNNELVRDNVTGFLAEAPTRRHLSLAMERAWENRHQWESMGKAAAIAIRKLLPADSAGDFAQRLVALAEK